MKHAYKNDDIVVQPAFVILNLYILNMVRQREIRGGEDLKISEDTHSSIDPFP